MKTHIELDSQLMEQVLSLGHFPTKKAAVYAALLELLKHLKRQQLLSLCGQIKWEANLDQLRRSRHSIQAIA